MIDKGNNSLKWFIMLQLVFLVVIGLLSWFLFYYHQQRQSLFSLREKLIHKARRYYGCEPKEFLKHLREQILSLKKCKSSLIARFMLVDSYRKEVSKVESPGLFFMQKLRDTQRLFKHKYPGLVLPENLGFSSQMPADKDVPYLLYELDALTRVINILCRKDTGMECEIVSITSILPDAQSNDNHLGYKLKVKLKMGLPGLVQLLKEIKKGSLIFVTALKIVPQKRPDLLISFTILPLERVRVLEG